MPKAPNHEIVNVQADVSFLSDLEDALESIGGGWLNHEKSDLSNGTVTHILNNIEIHHKIERNSHVIALPVYDQDCCLSIPHDGRIPNPTPDENGRRLTLTLIEDAVRIIHKASNWGSGLIADPMGDRFVDVLNAIRPQKLAESKIRVSFLMRGPWNGFGINPGKTEEGLKIARELVDLLPNLGNIAPSRIQVIQNTSNEGLRSVALLPVERMWGVPSDPIAALRDLVELRRRIENDILWQDE